jgi:hypothetical protein
MDAIQKAQQKYPLVDSKGKELLEDIFGKEALTPDLWERIKSFEDGLAYKGYNPEDVLSIVGKQRKETELSRHGLDKIEFLGDIFRNGWIADFSNPNQYKYRPYFIYKSGFGLSLRGVDDDGSYASVAARLYFPTYKMAERFANQFLPYYTEWILG